MTYFCLPEKPKRANEKKRKEKRKTQKMKNKQTNKKLAGHGGGVRL